MRNFNVRCGFQFNLFGYVKISQVGVQKWLSFNVGCVTNTSNSVKNQIEAAIRKTTTTKRNEWSSKAMTWLEKRQKEKPISSEWFVNRMKWPSWTLDTSTNLIKSVLWSGFFFDEIGLCVCVCFGNLIRRSMANVEALVSDTHQRPLCIIFIFSLLFL